MSRRTKIVQVVLPGMHTTHVNRDHCHLDSRKHDVKLLKNSFWTLLSGHFAALYYATIHSFWSLTLRRRSFLFNFFFIIIITESRLSEGRPGSTSGQGPTGRCNLLEDQAGDCRMATGYSGGATHSDDSAPEVFRLQNGWMHQNLKGAGIPDRIENRFKYVLFNVVEKRFL